MIRVSKNFMLRRVLSRSFVEFFCLTVPKKFAGELFVQKFLVAKKFSVSLMSGIDRKFLCFRGLCHDFSSRTFCLTVPKHFEEEPLYAVFQKFLVAKKFMDKREGEVSRFPSKNSCLTVPKNVVGEPFSLSLISGIEKVWMREWGVSRFSVENFLSHSAENFRRGTP